MNHEGSEPSKHRRKYRCPLTSRKYGYSCEHPCSDSKYGRTVHVAMKDNPLPIIANLSSIATVMSISHTLFSILDNIYFSRFCFQQCWHDQSRFREVITD